MFSSHGKRGIMHKEKKYCCCGVNCKKAGGAMFSLIAIFGLVFLIFNIVSKKKLDEVYEYEDMF